MWSKFNKIFHFKGLANGSKGNEKFEVLKILKTNFEIGNQMDVTVNYARTLCQI